MNKKFISGLMAATMTATALVGCSSSTGSETEKSNNKKDKVVITVMQNKVEVQEQFENAIKEFNASQDGIEVKALGTSGDNVDTILQTQFASAPEKAPTIFTTAAGTEMDKFLPYMAPMDDMKAAAAIAEGQEGDARRDGVLYGLPLALEGFGFIYNKDMFAQAGINAEEITSIDALVAACEKLAQVEGVEAPIAFAEESYFRFMHPFNWPFAIMEDSEGVIQQINKGELGLNDVPEVKEFVNNLDAIKPYTNLGKSSYDEQIAGFAMGQFAMVHQGNWAQTLINDYEVDFDYGFLPFPINGNQKLSVGNSNFFRLNKYATEEQQAAAKTFLDWLLTEEAGQRYITEEFKWIPPYTGFDTSSMDKLSQEVSKYAESGETLPWVFGAFPAGAHQEFANQMERYFAGQLTSEQLLDEITKVWVQTAK